MIKQKTKQNILEEILKDQLFYIRAANRYLKQTGKKNLIITGGDVYQEAMLSVLKSQGRNLDPERPLKEQFLLSLKSTAYNYVRKEIYRERFNKSYKKKMPVSCKPEFINDTMADIIKEYYNRIIENNNVDLYFMLKEMENSTSVKEIAEKYNLAKHQVSYLKKKIREYIRNRMN